MYNLNKNEIFIKKAIAIHGNKYDYDEIEYVNNCTHIKIFCKGCSEYFLKTPHNHIIKKQGCPKCSKKRFTKTLEQFKNESIAAHGDKYDLSYVVYKNCDTPVKIFCKDCNDFFYQTPYVHINMGCGCPKCGGSQRLTQEQFLNKSFEVHGNLYDYTEAEYNGMHKDVKIFCKKCKKFFNQIAYIHLHQGSGCPVCCGKTISKQSETYFDYLEIKKEYRDNFIININGRKFKPDAYIPELNIVFEYLGDYWHGNPEKYKSEELNKKVKKTFGQLYKETMSRIELIKNAGYNVIYIWENDWKNIKKWLVKNGYYND